MSFSSQLKAEYGKLTVKPPCCRRAYLHGLLFGATVEGDTVEATLPTHPDADYDLSAHVAQLSHGQLSREAEITPLTRGAHRYVRVRIAAKQTAKQLAALSALPEEEAAAEVLPERLGFRCDDCTSHFLRGTFVAMGTVSDPLKHPHLEWKLPNDSRAELFFIVLSELGYVPCRLERAGKVGLIIKNFQQIEDLLAIMGSTSLVFEFFNAPIQRELRNNANRGANCVAENINRATRAGGRQVAAIRALDKHNLLPSLSDDLRYTARLRLENPEASLPELAALHAPPITKSGLHHRMEKIMDLYEKACAEGIIPPEDQG